MKHQTPSLLFAALLTVAAIPTFAGQPVTIEDDKKAVAPPEEEDITVHPITDPYFNEDSSITTDARLWYGYERIGGGQPLGTGAGQVAALQLRVAVTHYLQIVAYKDGYTWIHTPGYNHGGWNNIAAGLKWQFIDQKPMHLTAAAGVGYELASGNRDSLQDYDEVRFWLSVDKNWGKLHVGANGGYHHGCNNGNPIFPTSDFVDWHLHADYEINKYFSPVLELNGYHTTSEGVPTTPFSGQDLTNLSGTTKGDVVTVAVGAEVRPIKHLGIRAAWEYPITNNEELISQRWTFSAVYTF
jgi:hypothetical protein